VTFKAQGFKSRAMELPIKPRSQWFNGGGYCAECSIQMAALNFGIWASQDTVRKAGGGGELLFLGHHLRLEERALAASGRTHQRTSDLKVALDTLHLTTEEWNTNQTPTPQHEAFWSWCCSHLEAGHPVVFGVHMVGSFLPAYDHIVLLTGFRKDAKVGDAAVVCDCFGNCIVESIARFVHPRDEMDPVDTFTDEAEEKEAEDEANRAVAQQKEDASEDVRAVAPAQAAAAAGQVCVRVDRSKTPSKCGMALPYERCFGIAVTGRQDGGPLLRASVLQSTGRKVSLEPNVSEGEAPCSLGLGVEAVGLLPTRKYRIVRFSSVANLVSGNIDKTSDIVEADEDGHIVWPDPDCILSNSVAIYRIEAED